jgi:hypothetical protein
MTQISEGIRDRFYESVSYQGVMKAVADLLRQGALEKTGKRSFQVSQAWLDSLSKGVSELSYAYKSRATIRPEDLQEGESATYSFESTVAEPHYWILDMCLRLKDPTKKFFVNSQHNAYPITSVSSDEFEKFSSLFKNNPMYILCAGTSDVDKLEMEAWASRGCKYKTGVEYSPLFEVLAIGDYVWQIYKEPRINARWRQVQEQKKPMKKKLVNLYNFVFKTRCNTKIVIQRNKAMAEKIRQEFREIIER